MSVLIRRLSVRGLLSFGEEAAPIDLLPLNVLIGPNASGKSNLVEVLGVLRAATKDIAQAFREAGAEEWFWKGKDGRRPIAHLEAVVEVPWSEMGLRYHLVVYAPARQELTCSESIQDEHAQSGEVEPYSYLGQSPTGPVLNVVNLPEGSQSRPRAMERANRRPQREELADGQSVLLQRNVPGLYPEISYLAEHFSAISIYRLWDTGPNAPIRSPSRADDFKSRLSDDAGNLALVLNNLLMHSETRKRILDLLRSFYDRAEDIVFDIYANRVQLGIRETGMSRPIPATRLSDGTLRYLGLLAVLCDPSPPPLICIEEPELGMHPDAISVIAELLIEASERTQLVVTTHSDLLVSKLRETPESILVCDWSEGGTVMKRLSSADVEGWPDELSLGDIWLKGGFGGTRW